MSGFTIISTLGRLRRRDDGAALVEFGLILPLMLLVFAISISSARTFWSYQATIAGVRDASRYVGRATPNDICIAGGDLSALQTEIEDIVRNASDGSSLFPSSITVVWVQSQLTCHNGDFRMASTPVAEISAQLEITYPMQGLFDFVGIELLPVLTVVRDQSRIFGA